MNSLSRLTGDWGLPKGASTFSPQVHFLWVLFLCITIFFTVLIVFLAVFFSIRYRRTPLRQHADPSPDHNTSLEITWTIIPLIIVMVIFALGFKYYMNMNIAPVNTYDIGVKAQKWNWTFTYPNHAISNKLYLPVNTPVKLSMTSADVLHGFWIPSLSIQKDVVPGRIMTIWIDPTRVGHYELQCAEYCGSGHSLMRAPVIVATKEEVNEYLKAAANIWVHNGKPVPLSEVGEDLYSTYGCNGCHTVNGTPGSGPTWKDLAGNRVQLQSGQTVTADYAYLKQAILYPGRKLVKNFPNIMPDFYSDFAGPGHTRHRRLNAMIWYINTLSTHANSDSRPPVPNIPGTKMEASPTGTKPVSTTKTISPVAPAGMVAMGKNLYFSMGCNACHTVNGKRLVGPSWKNLAGYPQVLTNGKTEVANYAFLKDMIINPNQLIVKSYPPLMPSTYVMKLGGGGKQQKKLDAILWYINSLSDKSDVTTVPPASAPAKPAASLPVAMVAMGKKLYTSMGCNACHTDNGNPGAGPSWKNLAGYPQHLANGKTKIADYAYLKYMILHPDKLVVKGFAPIMPAIYGTDLDGAKNRNKLDAIIWYINSLSDKRSKATEPPAAK